MKPEEIMTSNGWTKDPTSFDYWTHETLGVLIRSAGHWKWHKPGVRRPESCGNTLKAAMSVLGLYRETLEELDAFLGANNGRQKESRGRKEEAATESNRPTKTQNPCRSTEEI